MAKKVFVFSLIFACVLQFWTIKEFGMYDFNMWAKQAEYVETGNPAEFDYLSAYGHPGGPLIEATIALHRLGFSYWDALTIFMVTLDGFAIAGITLLCYLLKKDEPWWWLIVLIILCFNHLYYSSTPPSTTVSLVIAFLCLLSIYIYNLEKIGKGFFILLSLVIGLAVSIRADIGTVMSIALLFFLKPKISWKRMISVILCAGIFFVLFDPFMWFMPIKHIGDLWFKIFYHYAEFTASKLSWTQVLDFSSLALSSVVLSAAFVFSRGKQSPLPERFVYVVWFTTAGLYAVFLTAKYQAVRYFIPIIIIWEIFLPLLVLKLKNLQLWK